MEGLRAQPGLRPGRGREDGRGRHPAAGRHAALRRRLGLVLRLWRIRLAAHHGPGRPRPASRPPERPGPARGHARTRRRLAHGLPGQAGPAAPERRQRGQAVQEVGRRPRRPGLHGPGRRRAFATTRCSASSTAIARTSRSTRKAMFGLALEKLGEKDKLAMVLQNISQYVVRGRREPDGLPQAAQRGLLVVVVRQRGRDRRVLPQAAGPHRPEGRAGPAAGQVRAQQPQARQLLELDPRHGLLHRGPGRLPQGQRRGPARHDRGDRARRPDPQGSEDHAGRPLQLRQRVCARRQGRRDRLAHGLVPEARARARSTSTPT